MTTRRQLLKIKVRTIPLQFFQEDSDEFDIFFAGYVGSEG